jgi:hypothetical protein
VKILGCDLHARQQTLAILETDTREVVKRTRARRQQRARVLFQPRATRSSGNRIHWIDAFLNLMEELGIECLLGHPAEIRAAEPRKQKHSRRDADLLLSLLAEELRRSGGLRKNCWTCGPNCVTDISGCVCASKYTMRCRPLP